MYVSNGADSFLDILDRKTGKNIKRVPITGIANEIAITRMENWF